VRFFRRGLRMARVPMARPLALGALAALAAALVHGLVDNFYFVPDLAIAFWLLLALVEIDGKVTR
jgi:putative inorganic carbon (hco3(-)) transporter